GGGGGRGRGGSPGAGGGGALRTAPASPRVSDTTSVTTTDPSQPAEAPGAGPPQRPRVPAPRRGPGCRPPGAGAQAGPATTGGSPPPRCSLRGRNTAKTAGRGRTSTPVPPSAAAMLRARARPRPVPPGLLLTLRSKIRGTRSARTPLPSSRTSITTELEVFDVRIVTVPTPCTNALSSSVAITCDSV